MVRQAVNAAKRAGKLPGTLQIMAEAATPRTDWRDRFRQLIDGLRRDGLSWARPNRRYLPHGLYLPAQQRVGIGALAVVLDSSGSISATELAAYTGEVLGLLEETQPDELILIQCDTQVQAVERLRPGDGFDRIEIKGRGGTRFQPAFDWIADACARRAIDRLHDRPRILRRSDRSRRARVLADAGTEQDDALRRDHSDLTLKGLPHRLSDRTGAAVLVEALNYGSKSSLRGQINQQTNPAGVSKDTLVSGC